MVEILVLLMMVFMKIRRVIVINNIKFIGVVVFFFIIALLPFLNVNAEDKEQPALVKYVTDAQGNVYLVFETTDKTADSKTTWTTIGFNIRLDERKDGDPIKDKQFVTLYLNNSGSIKNEVRQGDTTYVTFKIPGKSVDKLLFDKFGIKIKNGIPIYLNGIFKVKENGVEQKGEYMTFNAISQARSWAKPGDFWDRFNIKVEYESANYPVVVEYQDSSGKVLDITTPERSGKSGDEITTTLKPTHGNYELYRSYAVNLFDTKKKIDDKSLVQGADINQVKTRNDEILVGGLKIIAKMRVKPKPPIELGTTIESPDPNNDSKPVEDEYIYDFEEPYATGIIAADNRGDEEFDVSDGIPSSENLYVNAFTTDYLVGFRLKKVVKSKEYPVTVIKDYNLSWTDYVWNEETRLYDAVHHSDKVQKKQDVKIKRYYAYWLIDNLECYALDSANIKNDALPGGSTTINAYFRKPTIDYAHNATDSVHITDPYYSSTIVLPSASISGGTNGKPDIPNEELQNYITYAHVGKPKVKNDKLVINGQTILSDTLVEKEGIIPAEYESSADEIGEDILYKNNLTIPYSKANGVYNTEGTVIYKSLATVNSTHGPTISYPVHELDDVIVHTPVVCDTAIETKKAYNQMVSPDKLIASLVLDTSFKISFPTTGSHRNIPGYQYNDYSKYIARREVMFPFDVYRGSEFIPENTWTSITGSGSDSFYLPVWVDEGKYTVHFKSTSINASANGGLNKTESIMNSNIPNYVATDSVSVEVSGRIFGLNIYDLTDYPIWENVFRKEKSMTHTGFSYQVGTKNHNGISQSINPKYTLTLVNGSHPTLKNQGVLKTGYAIRFSLKTMGNLTGNNDYINIKPKFYYVDENGKNRQEVDIYYSETFGGKKQLLVKMGSDKDKTNVKKLRLGDIYLSVPSEELNNKAVITSTNIKNVKGDIFSISTYTNIKIPSGLKTYIGTKTNIHALNTVYNNIPSSVAQNKRVSSIQKWYGEYYIPGEIHVVKKGFDLKGYASAKPLNFKENFWLKKGYIIINFDIESIKNGVRHLSYINGENAENGYCNMWKMEGYQYNKTDNEGTQFNFIDGDFVMYYAGKSINDDYSIGGTH